MIAMLPARSPSELENAYVAEVASRKNLEMGAKKMVN